MPKQNLFKCWNDTVEIRNQDFLPLFSFRTACKDDRSRTRAMPVNAATAPTPGQQAHSTGILRLWSDLGTLPKFETTPPPN